MVVCLWGLGLVIQGCASLPRSDEGTSASFKNAEIQKEYQSGQEALQNGEFAKARGVLTRSISSHPGEDDLAQVQWLIARTYEMEGRTEEAISEYNRFLRNYPNHPNAKDADEAVRRLEQVRDRAIAAKKRVPIRVMGGLSADYEFAAETGPGELTTVNRPSERMDFQIRNLAGGRGKVVFSGLKSFDLIDNTRDRSRIYKLYTQWKDSPDTLQLQFGRQPSTAGGLWTRYDGLRVGIRPRPTWEYEISTGFPVDFISQEGIGTSSRFVETGLHLLDYQQMTAQVYLIDQFQDGITDRTATGGTFQANWGRWGINAQMDYDLLFGGFNDRYLSLDYRIREPLRITAALDLRNDPYLQMDTALQDPAATEQGVISLKDWVSQQGRDGVMQMARDHTIQSKEGRLALRWDINPVWSGSMDYSHEISTMSDTVGSGLTDRTLDRYSAFLSEQNGWGWSEVISLLLLHQVSSDLKTDAAYLTGSRRFGSWMTLQMKGRVETAHFATITGSDYLRYVPGGSLTLDFSPDWNMNVETEYTIEKPDGGGSNNSIWSHFNMTRVF
jgi:tetratricopeptide (TPR) repeat protein